MNPFGTLNPWRAPCGRNALFAVAGVFCSQAFAAALLDEDPWPQVTPQYLGAERKHAPKAHPPADMQKPVRNFDRKVSARVEMVNGSPEIVIDGRPTYALWGVTPSRSPTGHLHKTTSTLRLAADFDAIHERLMEELAAGAGR